MIVYLASVVVDVRVVGIFSRCSREVVHGSSCVGALHAQTASLDERITTHLKQHTCHMLSLERL